MLWRCWLGGRKGIRPVKTERWGAGVVICLERGADLHMAQLMPLPLTVSCFSKIQIGFTFLVSAHPGSPGQRAVKRVCVWLCVLTRRIMSRYTHKMACLLRVSGTRRATTWRFRWQSRCCRTARQAAVCWTRRASWLRSSILAVSTCWPSASPLRWSAYQSVTYSPVELAVFLHHKIQKMASTHTPV